MEILLWVFIILGTVVLIVSIITGSGKTQPSKNNDRPYESEKDRRFRLAREKWIPKEIIEDSDKRWQLIVDETNQCLVYSNELEYSDFVLKFADMREISFSRNFELVFSTYPVYKDKLDDIHNIIPEWIDGSRYLKKGVRNLSMAISYSSEDGDSCHMIDLFDIEEFDGRKRGVRDMDDWVAPYLIEAYRKGLRVYEIFLKEMERREKDQWLHGPELPEGENPIERIKANTEFFQN